MGTEKSPSQNSILGSTERSPSPVTFPAAPEEELGSLLGLEGADSSSGSGMRGTGPGGGHGTISPDLGRVCCELGAHSQDFHPADPGVSFPPGIP